MNTRSLVGASALLLAAFGCRDDTKSPTEPTPTSPQATGAAAITLTFRQVSAGGFHTCGVTTDNRAYCWGSNLYGQLGDGTSTAPQQDCEQGLPCRPRPVPVVGGLTFRQVAAGGSHTCGLTRDNRVYCWGLNLSAQLGQGFNWGGERCFNDTWCSTRPLAVKGGLTFRRVSAGGEYTCGITTASRVFCWGDNHYGQIGDSTQLLIRALPVRIAGGRYYRELDAGFAHTCAVTTGSRVFCWGDGQFGVLGNGTTTQRRWPKAVSGGLAFERVTAGANHTCGETTTNRAYCWGWNRDGQLGDGTTTQRLTPKLVAGGLFFRQVSAGAHHTCGKTPADVAYCWGYNLDGALGDGTFTNRRTPTRVVRGELFYQVSAAVQTCGVTPGGVAYCWGWNGHGQLGDGTTSNRARPTLVLGPT